MHRPPGHLQITDGSPLRFKKLFGGGGHPQEPNKDLLLDFLNEPIEKIIRFTGLTQEQIERLNKKEK